MQAPRDAAKRYIKAQQKSLARPLAEKPRVWRNSKAPSRRAVRVVRDMDGRTRKVSGERVRVDSLGHGAFCLARSSREEARAKRASHPFSICVIWMNTGHVPHTGRPLGAVRRGG